MTNGDYIRSLNDDELSEFLFQFMIDGISGFYKNGGMGCPDAVVLKKFVSMEMEPKDSD